MNAKVPAIQPTARYVQPARGRSGLWVKGEFVSSNTVPAAPKAPEVVTKENVSWLAGIVSTLGFAFIGNGPLQWALAGIIVASFAGAAFLFIRKRLDPA